MHELDKILEETEQLVNMHYEDDSVKTIILRNLRDIRKHMNDGWIPVDKNNVPDHEILACDRYKNELIGYLSYNADSEEFVCESDECIMYQVIAWMEKPEPYRPERSRE